MALDKTKHNADKGSLILGYLSAFGISLGDSGDMPTAFRPRFEDEWDKFLVKTSYGNEPLDILYRALDFSMLLARKGHTNMWQTKPKLKGPAAKTLNAKTVYETLVAHTLATVAQEVSDMMRRTDLGNSFKVTRTKSTTTKTALGTTMLLERVNKKIQLGVVLPLLKDILKNRGEVPVQLREVIQTLSPTSKAKAKITTPKADSLMAQFGSSFGWLPLLRSQLYDAYLIRARDQKLVMKVEVPVDAHLMKVLPKATILRLWATAFRTLK